MVPDVVRRLVVHGFPVPDVARIARDPEVAHAPAVLVGLASWRAYAGHPGRARRASSGCHAERTNEMTNLQARVTYRTTAQIAELCLQFAGDYHQLLGDRYPDDRLADDLCPCWRCARTAVRQTMHPDNSGALRNRGIDHSDG